MNLKRAFVFILGLIFILSVGLAQEKQIWKGKIEYKDGIKVIENPEKPLSKNAGRILKLEEVLRIKDEGREFYFKFPFVNGLRVSGKGFIYVQDENQLFISYK